jgi:hypothetical protein
MPALRAAVTPKRLAELVHRVAIYEPEILRVVEHAGEGVEVGASGRDHALPWPAEALSVPPFAQSRWVDLVETQASQSGEESSIGVEVALAVRKSGGSQVPRVLLEVALGELAKRRHVHGRERKPPDPLSLLVESGDRCGFLPIVGVAGEPDSLSACAALVVDHVFADGQISILRAGGLAFHLSTA